MLKICIRCKLEKDEDLCFRFRDKKNNIRDRECKECRNSHDKEYYKNSGKAKARGYRSGLTKESLSLKDRNAYLKRQYKIDSLIYAGMLKEQNSQCAICGINTEQNGKRLAIDHNHKTGKIRGLLCFQCNWDLGGYEYLKSRFKLFETYLEIYDSPLPQK